MAGVLDLAVPAVAAQGSLIFGSSFSDSGGPARCSLARWTLHSAYPARPAAPA